MTPILLKSLTAIAAVAGLAFSSADDLQPAAYDGAQVSQLTLDDLSSHANTVFVRSDRDLDNALDVDEFTALAVVTAELAHLNGFVAIDSAEGVSVIELPSVRPAALSPGEHARIAAVAQHVFYSFAGRDGKMDAEEFLSTQTSAFEAADLNNNGALKRKELRIFAQRQAALSTGA